MFHSDPASNTCNQNVLRWDLPRNQQLQLSDMSTADEESYETFQISCSNGQNHKDAEFANIYTSDLEHCVDLSEENTVCEETKEMIIEAMSLPKELREHRLEEIRQHIRFLKRMETEQRISKETNRKLFDDTNIGLCSICFDENFQAVYPCGVDLYACKECLASQTEQK